MKTPSRTQKLIAGGVLVLGAFGAGAAVAVTGSASAASDAVSSAAGEGTHELDPSRSVRPDEHLLTGATADKVTAAVTARYPNAQIQRVETDSEGVYEAHIVTADGEQLIVQVGKDFTVTGTQAGGGHGGPGDHHGFGRDDDDRDGDDGGTPESSAFLGA